MAAQNDPLGSTGIPSFSIEQNSTRRVGCCCCLVALIQHRTPTTQRQVERMACTQGDNTREKKQPEKEVQASKTSLEASFSVGDQRRRRRRSVAPDWKRGSQQTETAGKTSEESVVVNRATDHNSSRRDDKQRAPFISMGARIPLRSLSVLLILINVTLFTGDLPFPPPPPLPPRGRVVSTVVQNHTHTHRQTVVIET